MKILKTFLVTILLMSILITSLFLCSCHDDDEPNNQDRIKIYTYNYLYLKQDNCSAIIKSVEDITYICDEETSPIFEENQYERNKNVIATLREYDEEFFLDKSLVVLFRLGSSGTPYVKEFEVNEESLNITLANETPKESGAYPLIVFSRVYFLEFDKEKVKDVTEINVQEILIQK